MKQVIGILLAILFAGFLNTQDVAKKTEIITFTTSAECGMCKKKIENELNYTSGVSFCEVDFVKKTITVKFKSKKITAQKIKEIVVALGYDAGELKADQKAYDELPECCKKGGHH